MFATVDDMEIMWRELSQNERQRAAQLLKAASDALRIEADKVGKDLDIMILEKPALETVAKSVTVDIVSRMLMSSTDAEPVSQYSQSAMGYTVSGTYLSPGGGLYIKKSELARLGLRRQRVGARELYED